MTLLLSLLASSDAQSILWFLAGAAALLWGNSTRHRCRYLRRHGRPATGLVGDTVAEWFSFDDSTTSSSQAT